MKRTSQILQWQDMELLRKTIVKKKIYKTVIIIIIISIITFILIPILIIFQIVGQGW
jgi:hypothetical protein